MSSWDALMTAALAGREVPGLEVGTAIVPTYPRHPLALASQALTAQAIAGWPALVAVGSFEMLARLIRGAQPDPLDELQGAVDEPVDEPPAAPVEDGHEVDETLAGLAATARDRFPETLDAGALPSTRALRRELHIGHPRAVAVRAVLDEQDHRGPVAAGGMVAP